MTKRRLKALLDHIGGETQLRTILADFYQRMANDVLIGFFFSGKDSSIIAEKQAHFMLHAMGVVQTYQGKSPHSAHIELPPILSGHFDRRQVILRETLQDFRVAEDDIQTWMGFENAFREVVESRLPKQK